MPVFEYRGLNSAGKQIKGLLEADSPKTLRSKLRADGVFLTDVLAQAEGSRGAVSKGANAAQVSRDIDLRKLGRGRVNTDDVAIFTRQLSTLLGAGVTLVESLTALVDQVEKERFKRALSDIKQRVNEGSTLADALAQHPKIFPNIYVNMVRAGEASGALDAVLTRLADFTENQARLQQKILSTMLYPAIMMVVGGGILVALMVFVVPKVTKIFETMKATLPLSTRILIATSNFFQNWWFVAVPMMALGVWLFMRWTKSPKGKPKWDRFVLKAPVVGSLVRLLSISRFARTLSTLLKSGVPLLAAMDIVKAIMTNTVLAEVIEKARDSIREGESIATPLKRSGEFPPLVYHMVAIGERSGQLEDMLTNVADNYETQVNVRIGALTSLLEPLLIVVMGAVIAFVALSILLPILQVNSAIR
ncbi:type II secretion system inner membrane protein GspF [Myxococcus sp. CA051A]|uniref:Type II secretion system protein GspF n=1 Tax=Myxococcus llanfairpwllgwyngyllgogerychwyrndrobwllllantysiliogogogochensis TaxID=2590453 RepID=A0A540X1D7_9BACT|nr:MULTISPECIES: type II secretion system inner membrane protein GspF [Myxococcus]NTX04224.1 type II secretion system inner membrane protein GspF [Myxococcus sp. CA040A]NTX13156.1 type II secretion system inner membrane protein GspF [Myxococcus sp. CA056]NTX36393.1 type II secretion system inner membrane protein GspF [Myxococcus sp. CA033]NTX50988.1 type II secretion system inner membrane protein GspF [Myxococcus sp. CA039A]NTX64701.1 type II secretion system inner membrane protein GspF [Myxoc